MSPIVSLHLAAAAEAYGLDRVVVCLMVLPHLAHPVVPPIPYAMRLIFSPSKEPGTGLSHL